jgi:hypothetical protein
MKDEIIEYCLKYNVSISLSVDCYNNPDGSREIDKINFQINRRDKPHVIKDL